MSLSSKKQHELLAALALTSILEKRHLGFLKRYEELLSWVELDRYTPPSHIPIEEALKFFFDFHNSFLFYPIKHDEDIKNNKPLVWQKKFNISIYADQIRSPYNVGSIIRIIDNFGFKELILSSDTMDLKHPRIKKTARGAESWIPVKYEKNPYEWLKNTNLPVIALETGKGSININEWNPPAEAIIVTGNEEHGLSKEILKICNDKVNIPMYGYKNSMNVTHALAILGSKIISVLDA